MLTISEVQKAGANKIKTILAADDRKEILELVSVTLEGSPYEVMLVTNGTQALQAAQKYHPDLILLDIVMPGGIDGLEVCRRLKGDPETSDINILIMTSKYSDEIALEIYESQANGLLPKPFSPRGLLITVERLLEN
ncbi:MAG: response regulator [Anaerolineae bacterium]|nr:response regulator [Anaerolineae bacterium]